ncbi:hypothetical protein FB45DRAFT_894447 [Roridomyces roridus]|uniref:F-box domain-containing protein n=1 Tax=Roridomyces roridus TaxID=1738132 RepID=A0AAD7CG70_9AGAR|nr:hypothetical protein FB45DRAFT_894447 [Roridomyces roridus]
MCTTVNNLPHELLGEIFTHCSALVPDAPLVLGQVSRLFRHIAYSTPTAWTHLRLGDSERGSTKAALWLTRSKACPINVEIRTDASSSVQAVEVLREHARRIETLGLHTDTQVQAREVLAAVYGGEEEEEHHTGLRSLRICVASNALAPEILAFPPIPSITHLETTNVALGTLQALDLACLENLRIIQPLVSDPVATEDVLELASAAPRLQTLHVEARIADPRKPIPETGFLGQLTELDLRTNNLVPLLDQLIVPSLHTLRLRDLDGGRAGASTEMGAALDRMLLRMESEEGDVITRHNELRVVELAGVHVDLGDQVWKRCTERMKRLEKLLVNVSEQVETEEVPKVEEVREVRAGFSFGFGAK